MANRIKGLFGKITKKKPAEKPKLEEHVKTSKELTSEQMAILEEIIAVVDSYKGTHNTMDQWRFAVFAKAYLSCLELSGYDVAGYKPRLEDNFENTKKGRKYK